MRKIYISFLGLGSYDHVNKTFRYHPTTYELNGKTSSMTEFIQAAELEILGADQFDNVFIAATQASYDANFSRLEAQLKATGAEP